MPLLKTERELLLEQLPGMAYRCAVEFPWPMQYVSPGVRFLCSFEPADFIEGRVAWGDLVHPDDSARVAEEVRQSVVENRSFQLTYRIVDEILGEKHLFERGRAIPEGRALVGFIVDITERVAAEERLRQLQNEVADLSRQVTLGALGSTIAHELNQPLGAAVNLAGVAGSLVEDSSPVAPLIAQIESHVLRAGEIVRRAKELNHRPLARECVFASDLVRDAIEMVVPACANIELETSLYAENQLYVDTVQIQQVLINLLTNACEAIQEARKGRIMIAAADTNESVIVSVANGPPGIPQEILPFIFDSHFTTKRRGMGLGLAISRTIVDAHGGRIWAENRDECATISFELPAASVG